MRTESPQHLGHGRKDNWDTAGVLLDESVAAGPFTPAELFGNTRPVELEIGVGKGAFLLVRAPARPEVNFLGLEWARSYATYAADRCRRAKLTNVRILRANAGHVARICLPESSVWRVHVYFPDPWPKRRHHRRRLITKPFLTDMRRILQPGGQLLIVTDHLHYAQHIHRTLEGEPNLLEIPFPVMSDKTGELVRTNFERKYITQGRNFYHVARMCYK